MKTLGIRVLIIFLFVMSTVNAQMGVGTRMPHPDAMLEVRSANKGLLLPRLALSSSNSAAPLSAHIEGMSVYNTAEIGDVTPGFYYNDGSKWIRLASGLVADATTTSTGKIKLAGDLGGSADAPTVPGLANKENSINKSNSTTLGNSDELFPTQNAVKTYVDAAIAAGTTLTGSASISVLSGAISLNNDGVTTSKILDDAVTTSKIPNQTISTPKIANNAVTIAKLPPGATASTFLRGDGNWALPITNTASTSILLNGLSFERAAFTGDVTASQNDNILTIAPSAVNNAKIANLAVDGAKIANLAITMEKIEDGAVSLTKQANIASGSLLGRSTAGSGSPEVLTSTAAKTLLALTKTDVGLANVDNTTDLLKPISTATQNALDLKANLTSPAFTGIPLAPTAAVGTNNTQIATTAYVDAANRTIFSTRISLSSSITPAPVGSSLFNYYTLTALAEPATFNAPSGAPLDGNSLVIKIKASGAEMALAWNAIFRGGTDISLPTITNKTMVLHFMYNTQDAKWDLVGITNGI